MTIFHLPDLGEGLAEATIHEWHVKVGDHIKTDQNMVSVETAKALVDIPSPFTGTITKLYFNAGDVVKTGAALLEVDAESGGATVAGKLESSEVVLESESAQTVSKEVVSTWQARAEKVTGTRLTMSRNMQRAHRSVVHASIFEEVPLPDTTEKVDVTVKLIQALCFACEQQPALNAWYDESKQALLVHKNVDLGLAVDIPQGLFVPVIKNAEQKNPSELRTIINDYKKQLLDGHYKSELFQGTTITLSNIGNMAGRFATAIVLPPTVAIVAVGKTYEKVIKQNDAFVTQRCLPLSLSFDHRVVTGAEGTRFLQAMREHLQK